MGSKLITNHVLKHGARIGHATIVSNRLEGKGYGVPGYSLSPTFITIHNVGDDNDGDNVSGKKYYDAMHGANIEGWRQAGYHLVIDYNKVYQCVAFDKVTWHAGDGKYGKGNRNSIGIEHCQYTDKEKQRMVWENSVAVCKELMKEYLIDLDHIVQHYYWTKKDCPYLLRHGRFGFTWRWYKNLFSESEKPKVPFLVKIKSDKLNVRTGPGTSYPKVMQLDKDDIYTIVDINKKCTWGKLKSGVGWICITDNYVTPL